MALLAAGRGRVVTAFGACLAAAVTALSVLTVDAAAVGITSGTVTVTGSGFGHGVGLSQYGALGMARAGADVSTILEHYYSGVDVVPVRDDVDVRVNVVHAARSVVLSTRALADGGGAFRIVPDAGLPVMLGAGDTVTVTPSSSSGAAVTLAVRRAGAGTAETSTSGRFTVQWAGTRAMAGPDTLLSVSALRKRAYRWGQLVVTPTNGLVDAVAVVGLHDEYLRGIAEMPSSWPAAALQVQVVAARNYALTAAGTTPRASCGGCQLWDDVRSQVFNGWAKESETVGGVRWGDRWVAAVRATQASATTGIGVLYQGKPVTAYFASSTGGRTRNSADVWGTAVPYLRSVDDPWSVDASVNPSFARWTRTTSVSKLLSLFGLRTLVSVRVTSRDAGGAARVVTAVSGDGTVRTMSGNAFASKLGLPGAWVTGISLPALPGTGAGSGSGSGGSGSPSPSPSGSPSPSPSPTTSVAPVPVPSGSPSGRPWSRFADTPVGSAPR